MSLFLGKERPDFRRKRDLYERLLTAMAQILPSLKFVFFALQNWFRIKYVII